MGGVQRCEASGLSGNRSKGGIRYGFFNFMKSASNIVESSDFSVPEGIVMYPIDPSWGLLG